VVNHGIICMIHTLLIYIGDKKELYYTHLGVPIKSVVNLRQIDWATENGEEVAATANRYQSSEIQHTGSQRLVPVFRHGGK
jgi:hypothetical protein